MRSASAGLSSSPPWKRWGWIGVIDMYDNLVRELQCCPDGEYGCSQCEHRTSLHCRETLMKQAADAIEELLKVAKKMHLWIFLHSGDEQAAYDECGLSDEMNAAIGYSGQFELRAEPPKEETE